MLIASMVAAAAVGTTFAVGTRRLVVDPFLDRLRGGLAPAPIVEPPSAEPAIVHEKNPENWTGEDRAVMSANTKTWVAVGSTVAAGVGTFYPPLRIVSGVGILYIAADIAVDAVEEIRIRRRLSVDALALIITGACLTNGLLFACSLNLVFAMVARRMTANARHTSQDEILSVFENDNVLARLVHIDGERQVPVAEVDVGEIVRVHAGEMIPIDGVVARGSASVDQRVLTGEDQPAERSEGDAVLAMTMVLSGTLDIRVRRAGPDTVAAEVARVLQSTMDQKTDSQLRVEDLGNRTVLPSLAFAAGLWPFLGPSGALALVQSHPKYKPIIASHLGLLTAYQALIQRGVLVKDARSIELLADVDVVVFDKTGTLTTGDLEVVAVHPVESGADDIVRWAASLEINQSHPIARSIVAEARARGLETRPLDDAEVVLGFGLKGVVGGARIAVGSPRFMDEQGVVVPPSIAERARQSTAEGGVFVMIAADGRCAGALELRASMRPESREVVRILREQFGKQVHIISGDHRAATRRIADELGVDGFHAEVLPEGKARLIEEMRAAGHSVCFVGDGINDAVALAAADVSISLEGASSIAQDAAMVILADERLDRLPYLLDRAEYEARRGRWTLGLVTLPHVVGFVGALGFGLGFIHAVVFNQVGLALGLGHVWQTRDLTSAFDKTDAHETEEEVNP